MPSANTTIFRFLMQVPCSFIIAKRFPFLIAKERKDCEENSITLFWYYFHFKVICDSIYWQRRGFPHD